MPSACYNRPYPDGQQCRGLPSANRRPTPSSETGTMPERQDVPPSDERAQPRPLPVAPETGDQASAEGECYPLGVRELK
jgi:hypothetical protein